MSRERYDTGIDWLRLAAAILVIAIHTSPLADFSETGNFILTRVLARIAVPFFFITSGYFLLSRYHDSDRKLRHFLKKTGWIYGASILLYLPLNFRNGYFSQSQLLPELLKDLIFDGTMYHLWYLPASMLGMLIAWKLVEKLDFSKGLVMALLLYLVGLFGDSYYVVVEKLPLLKAFYDRLFELFDYTRNGLFFAPVFLMLGGFIADERRKLSSVEAGVGFLISLGLLLAEALILHRHGFQRHDSMYVFLLPAMYFLFHLVLLWKGRRIPLLRPASLVVYLIHPLVIAAVWRFSSQNSLFHFGLVCLLSLLFSFAMAALWLRFSFKKPHNPEKDRAYIELNLANLTHNVSVLKAALPANAELMGVVKREAYGHGSYAVATHLEKTGVKAFAVATIDEGIALRRYGIRGEILILGFTDVRRAKELKTYRLTQTLIDFPYAEKLNRQKIPVSVHIAIDSGMHRLGLDTDDLEGVQKLFQMKHLHIQGIFTHLCCADSRKPEDISFTDIMAIMGKCLERGINLYTTKEGYSFDNTINSKVLCFAFGLVAEIERNLISMRTREALALRRAEGMVLGRRHGSYTKMNVLIKNRQVVITMLNKGKSISDICKHFDLSRDTFAKFRMKYPSVQKALDKKEQLRISRFKNKQINA